MNKKDVLIFFGFVVAPLGFFAAGVYYGPKVKKWYAGYSAAKKTVGSGPGDEEPVVENSDMVQIKKIDPTNKTITLSLNNNPDMIFSYKTGGMPITQIVNVPGLDSTDIALRYADGKFSVTDGNKTIFEQTII